MAQSNKRSQKKSNSNRQNECYLDESASNSTLTQNPAKQKGNLKKTKNDVPSYSNANSKANSSKLKKKSSSKDGNSTGSSSILIPNFKKNAKQPAKNTNRSGTSTGKKANDKKQQKKPGSCCYESTTSTEDSSSSNCYPKELTVCCVESPNYANDDTTSSCSTALEQFPKKNAPKSSLKKSSANEKKSQKALPPPKTKNQATGTKTSLKKTSMKTPPAAKSSKYKPTSQTNMGYNQMQYCTNLAVIEESYAKPSHGKCPATQSSSSCSSSEGQEQCPCCKPGYACSVPDDSTSSSDKSPPCKPKNIKKLPPKCKSARKPSKKLETAGRVSCVNFMDAPPNPSPVTKVPSKSKSRVPATASSNCCVPLTRCEKVNKRNNQSNQSFSYPGPRIHGFDDDLCENMDGQGQSGYRADRYAPRYKHFPKEKCPPPLCCQIPNHYEQSSR